MAQATNNNEPQSPQVIVNAQYIKDLSFENPNGIRALMEIEEEPEVSVHVEVEVNPVEDKTFEVELILKVKVGTAKKAIYLAELRYAGIFTVASDTEELTKLLLLVECPRLLFPFARAILADVTRESGLPPLVLAPFDFMALYQQRS
jgi:preprotein translocase subunit SecB